MIRAARRAASLVASLVMNNALYLRRRDKVLLPLGSPRGAAETAEPEALLPVATVATLSQNLEALGYALTPDLMEACRRLSREALGAFYQELLEDLKRAKGAHRRFAPMYPNFPEQVMETSRVLLYVNALLHYWTGGRYLPPSRVRKRPALEDATAPKWIDLGTQAEFEALFGQIASSNTSLSPQDREDLAWFVETYGESIERLLPAAIPQKENLAFTTALLMRHTRDATAFVERYFKTATDVLRLAAAASDGDVSLASPTRFRSFSRAERRLMLSLIDRQPQATEDMLRWKDYWVRLGEKLHPGEYRAQFPRAAAAFDVLRNDLPFPTFGKQVEGALARADAPAALGLLSTRPGEFARRLDHLLRLPGAEQEQILTEFARVADRVSTPVLLQVREHFLGRTKPFPVRVFFPKGALAKAHAEPNALPALSPQACARAAEICEATLVARFGTLAPLGRCYVDEALANYVVPFSNRSASKALRTLVRGSRLPLPEPCEVLRFFVWWKNGDDRTDIDLSATLYDAELRYVDVLSYYNLKGMGGVHSGDIVDAPKGASEFIDVSLSRLHNAGIRYVVMTLHSYTQQPYIDLPECFAGWMARAKAGSGEVYEPKTVQDRLDLTANTRIAVPLLIDVAERQVVWCDLALKNSGCLQNNVATSRGGIMRTLQSLIQVAKPNLYDLFLLHVRARGERVATPKEAERVFSPESGIAFRHEEIASEYLQ